jgi:hypothetical protein
MSKSNDNTATKTYTIIRKDDDQRFDVHAAGCRDCNSPANRYCEQSNLEAETPEAAIEQDRKEWTACYAEMAAQHNDDESGIPEPTPDTDQYNIYPCARR